jgi:hypothetical protein
VIPGLVQRRDLDRSELVELVGAFAARAELWRPCVRHEPDRRIFTRLWQDDHVTAWLICWMAGHDTGFHDHDGSSGAVAVLEGAVREEKLRFGHVPHTRELRAGSAFDFGPSDIHRVVHAGGAPAITLHAYSPPLRSMGAYVQQPEGTVQRLLLGENEELRPMAARRQPASTGSSAASLTSVSASSAAGSLSATTPTPA